jgi:hypothetical protein
MRFDTLIKEFPKDLIPRDGAILLQYIHTLEGKFGLISTNKLPSTLVEAQEWASKIETKLIVSKINAPITKIETQYKETSDGNITLLDQNLDQTTIQMRQT